MSGVPVNRFYTVIAVSLLITNPLSYFAGSRQGDTSCQLEEAKINVETQKKVYQNDLQVDKNAPYPSDDDWGDWMRKQLPLISD